LSLNFKNKGIIAKTIPKIALGNLIPNSEVPKINIDSARKKKYEGP
jgi:hypothetical protein